MRSIRVALCLLALILGCRAQGGQIFERTQFYSSQWDPFDTSYKSFLACSQMCGLTYPTCKAFAFTEGNCQHGKANFKPEKSGDLITGYMLSSETKAMEFLATLSAEQESERLSKFIETQFVIGDQLFWRSRDTATFQESLDECRLVGGTLPVLHDKRIFDGFINTVLPVPSDKHMYLGIEGDVAEGCSESHCDGKMSWVDGQVFNYSSVEEYIPCVQLRKPHEWKAFGMYLANCKGGSNWRLTDTHGNNLHLFACQFQL